MHIFCGLYYLSNTFTFIFIYYFDIYSLDRIRSDFFPLIVMEATGMFLFFFNTLLDQKVAATRHQAGRYIKLNNKKKQPEDATH